MSMLFYTGKMFPPKYHGGAFIAFHGSAYRAPLPEDGYEIVFHAIQGRSCRGLHRLRQRIRRQR